MKLAAPENEFTLFKETLVLKQLTQMTTASSLCFAI